MPPTAKPSAREASAQGFAQGRRAIAEGASRGADQPPVSDEAVVEAVIDGQIAGHSGLLEARSQTMAVVEQRVEAADDQMRRRQAGEIGEDRRGAPVALRVRPFEIGFPDPALLRLRQPGTLTETLPRWAFRIGREAAVDQQHKAEGALADIARGECGWKSELGPGGVAADREPGRIDAEAGALARGETDHRHHFVKG